MSYKENAKRFLKYLHDNDCTTTGALGEKEVSVDDGFYYCHIIRLESQVAELTIEFHSDETINVAVIDLESQEGELKKFDTFDDFCTWYASCHFTWTSDLGAGARLLVKEEDDE